MLYRIDPLTLEGTFDNDFYGSDEYADEVRVLKYYLKEEGFDEKMKEEFIITIKDRAWSCKPNKES